MEPNLMLRQKYTFRARNRQIVLIKKANERETHVLMKALMWALYLPYYPELTIEVDVGAKYRPDVVQLANQGHPIFWGESARVSLKKMRTLVQRLRATHLVFARWNAHLAPTARLVRQAAAKHERSAPVDLLSFPEDSVERFINANGRIRIGFDDLTWMRLQNAHHD